MTVDSQKFSNFHIQLRHYYIRAGSVITEIHLDNGKSRAVSGKVTVNVDLDTKRFKVIIKSHEQIPGYVCFEFKSTNTDPSIVYVHQNDIEELI